MREGELVGKNGDLVVMAVTLGIGELQHAIGQLLFELVLLEIQPCRITDVEMSTIINAAHDRMPHQRRRGGDFEDIALGQCSARRFGRGMRDETSQQQKEGVSFHRARKVKVNIPKNTVLLNHIIKKFF